MASLSCNAERIFTWTWRTRVVRWSVSLSGRGSGGVELPDSSGCRQCDDSAASAGIKPFAADTKGRLEAQSSFAEHFETAFTSLRDRRGERLTFEHHRLHKNFSAIQCAGVWPFDRLSRPSEIFITTAEIPWLEDRIDQQRPRFEQAPDNRA